jgi:integrase
MTIDELLTKYLQWAEDYFRNEQGTVSDEFQNLRFATKFLRPLFGSTEACRFGPVALRAVQAHMVKTGLSRKVVNARIERIRRVFKWAVSFELIPSSVYEAIRTLPGLKFGRGGVRESPGIQPVAHEHVKATLPFLPVPVAAIVGVQWLTGARPGEIRIMRAVDLDMSKDVWVYRPSSHKNTFRGRDRLIFLGKQAQEIIKPFLTLHPEGYLFRPKDSFDAACPHQQLVTRTKRPIGPHYTRHSCAVAIRRAAKKAGARPSCPRGGSGNRHAGNRQRSGAGQEREASAKGGAVTEAQGPAIVPGPV